MHCIRALPGSPDAPSSPGSPGRACRAHLARRPEFVATPKKTFLGRLCFPYTFPLQNFDFGKFSARIGNKNENCRKHIFVGSLDSPRNLLNKRSSPARTHIYIENRVPWERDPKPTTSDPARCSPRRSRRTPAPEAPDRILGEPGNSTSPPCRKSVSVASFFADCHMFLFKLWAVCVHLCTRVFDTFEVVLFLCVRSLLMCVCV